MSDHETHVGIEIDIDEAPMFDIDHRDEPDDDDGARGSSVRREGVTIPWQLVEYGNGKLPESVLVPIGIYRHRLHASAAQAFLRLRTAAREAGIDLTCTDTYRPYEEQVDLKRRKPNLSATPGRSVHGWGFAVDVSIGLPPKAFGHSVYRWLQEHAPAHGWHLGRPKDEPWHWVYRGPIDVDVPPPGDAPAAAEEPSEPGWALPSATVAALLEVDADDRDVLIDAVRSFQGDHDLAVDGIVGPITAAALWAETAPDDRPETSIGATGDTVVWIQRRVGTTVDGEFGPVTDRAVREFQRGAGLADDGVVGPRTWAAMTGVEG